MKVLVLTDQQVWTPWRKGAFEYRYRVFLESLQDSGVEVSYIYLNRGLPSQSIDSDTAKRFRISSVTIQPPPTTRAGRNRQLLLQLFAPHQTLQHDAVIREVVTQSDVDAIIMLNAIDPAITRNLGALRPSILFAEEDFAQSWDAAVTASAFPKLRARIARAISSRALPLVDVAAIISPAQRKWAQSHYPKARITLLPLFLDEEYWLSEIRAPKSAVQDIDIFAIGDFNFARNAFGLKAFLDELALLEPKSTPKVWLASRNGLHPILMGLPKNRLEFLGNIDDPITFYDRSRLTVVPAFNVSGAKNQILQAWAAGCPVVTSMQSAKSVDAVHEIDLLVGASAKELALLALSALEDERLKATLVKNGRAKYLRNHSRSEIVESFRSEIASLAALNKQI